MDDGEGGRQLCHGLTPGGCGTTPGRKWRLTWGGGQPSTRQSVGLHSGVVKVSVVSVDVTWGRVDRPVSTVPDSIDVDVNGVFQLDRQAQSGSGLPLRGGGGATGADCDTFVVGGPASAFLSGTDGSVNFAGNVSVAVASSAVLAGDVAVGVASLAVAGVPGRPCW